MKPLYFVASLLLLSLLLVAPRLADAAPAIVDPGQGTFTFSGSGATELSGITYAGGTSYYAVSDTTPLLYPLNVTLNLSTAFVTGVTVNPGVTLKDSGGVALPNTPNKLDGEGIAYDPLTGKVWVANESEPGIRRHDPTTGNEEQLITPASHPQLGVFANRRVDFGWESLTRSATGSVTWTANEESLTTDGPQSTPTTGTAVRLQRFDGSMTPTGQWAYITDPNRGPITFPSFPTDTFSGVSDMQVLPDGSLLVLERAFGGSDGSLGLPQFRSRLYWVSASELTAPKDVSGLSNLDTAPVGDLSAEPWQPALAKTLLWEQTFASADFDGITIGQTLANGDLSLLLIADDQGGLGTQGLYPLRLVTNVPEPSSLVLGTKTPQRGPGE
jgi:hypothetical protein